MGPKASRINSIDNVRGIVGRNRTNLLSDFEKRHFLLDELSQSVSVMTPIDDTEYQGKRNQFELLVEEMRCYTDEMTMSHTLPRIRSQSYVWHLTENTSDSLAMFDVFFT